MPGWDAPWKKGGGKQAPRAAPRAAPANRANTQRVAAAEQAREERRKPEFTEKQVFRLAARLHNLSREPGTDPSARDTIDKTLRRALAGYGWGPRRAAALTAATPPGIDSKITKYAREYNIPEADLRAVFEKVRPPFQASSDNPFVWAMEQASRPVQAVTSGVAEWSRQGEKNPVDLGLFSLRLGIDDPGEILTAVKEGAELKRRDTPASIAEEAGKIRSRQKRRDPSSVKGDPREAFGFLPGTNLRKGEVIPGAGKPGRVAYDVLGMAALDPLTYLTFGTGAAAKASLGVVTRVLGAERAAAVANAGIKVLTAEEKARLAKGVMEGLRGAKGGIGVRVPFRGGKVLAPPQTVISTKAVSKPIGAVAKKAVTADNRAAQAARIIERMFVPRAGVKQAARAGELPGGIDRLLRDLENTREAGVQRAISQDVNSLVRATRKAKATPDELIDVRRALEQDARAMLPDRLRPVYDEFDRILRSGDDSLLAEAQRTGILGERDPETMLDPNRYSPHVLTEEGRKAQRKASGSDIFVRDVLTDQPGGYSRARRDPDATIEEINAANREALGGGDLLETDPLKASAERIVKGRTDVGNRDFIMGLSDLKDDAGRPLLRPPEFDDVGRPVMPPGHVAVDVQGVGPVVVHEAIADSVRRVAAFGERDVHAMVRGWDKFMRLWKGYATTPFPLSSGFSIRNQIGNMWNNWAKADILPTDPVYALATRLRSRAAKGMNEGDPLKYLAGEQRTYVDLAYDKGVIGEGFFTTDLGEDVTRRAQPRLRDVPLGEKARRVGRRANPLDPQNAALATGRRFNSFVEDTSRLAHFIKKYRELGNADEAAASVKQTLFDYNELTVAEREAFKRVIPFYTWMRKNTPLQIGNFLRQPGKYVKAEILRRALTDAGPGYETEDMPQWMIDAGASVPASIDGQPLAWVPDTPYQSAGETLAPIVQAIRKLKGEPGSGSDLMRSIINAAGIGGLAGLPKAALEVATGKEAFSGRPFYPGERVDVPAYLELFNQLGIVPDSIPREDQFLLEALMPGLSKIRTIAPNDPRDEDAGMRRRLSLIFGQSLWPLGETTRRGEAYRRLDLEQATQDLLQSLGYEPPQLPRTTTKTKAKTTKSERWDASWR